MALKYTVTSTKTRHQLVATVDANHRRYPAWLDHWQFERLQHYQWFRLTTALEGVALTMTAVGVTMASKGMAPMAGGMTMTLKGSPTAGDVTTKVEVLTTTSDGLTMVPQDAGDPCVEHCGMALQVVAAHGEFQHSKALKSQDSEQRLSDAEQPAPRNGYVVSLADVLVWLDLTSADSRRP